MAFGVAPVSCNVSEKCASRVKDFVATKLEEGMVAGDVVLWYDWMQSMSFPQAHIETNLMFYGPQRKEVSVFGCFIAQCHSDGHTTLKNVIIVTDVRDHTCEAAVCLVGLCKQISG